MYFKIVILILLLFAFYCVFTYKCYKKLPFEYNFKFVRRIYYLFAMAYIVITMAVFKDTIESITLFAATAQLRIVVNYAVAAATLFLLAVAWEYLFISCKTFKTVKFKDFEISTEEQSQTEYVDRFQEREINSLYSVLEAKIKMVEYIDDYVAGNELVPKKSYFDILCQYPNYRGDIQLYMYYEDQQGIDHMQKELKLSLQQLSAIMYSVDLFGFCIPEEFEEQAYSFTRIKTQFLEQDILLVLKSDLLIDNEYSVIVDIINYFELKISYEILISE